MNKNKNKSDNINNIISIDNNMDNINNNQINTSSSTIITTTDTTTDNNIPKCSVRSISKYLSSDILPDDSKRLFSTELDPHAMDLYMEQVADDIYATIENEENEKLQRKEEMVYIDEITIAEDFELVDQALLDLDINNNNCSDINSS